MSALEVSSLASGFICLHDKEVSIDEISMILREFPSNESAPEFKNKGTGRGAVYTSSIQKSGTTRSIIVRKARRGGLISRVIDSWYFILPQGFPEKTRMWEEFCYLRLLREQGVRVPEPVFAAARRSFGLWYEGYLSTCRVHHAINLLEYAQSHDNHVELNVRAFDAGTQARRMLGAGVFHGDLHIGNVLVSPGGVYLIDFDKAEVVNHSVAPASYAGKLFERWERSLLKRIDSASAREALLLGFRGGLLCQ